MPVDTNPSKDFMAKFGKFKPSKLTHLIKKDKDKKGSMLAKTFSKKK